MKKRQAVKKELRRGKGGVSFVSVVKECLEKGVTSEEEILKALKKSLPDVNEKKLRARINATIKYLGKKPEKKQKVEKKKVEKTEKKEETKKEEKKPVTPETPVKAPAPVEPLKIDTSKGPSDTLESIKGPEAAQSKLGDALADEKKEDGDVGDIVIS